MIVLGRIESSAGLDPGDDRGVEHVRSVELGDIGRGNTRLGGIRRKNCRAILSPEIRPLAVEFGRVVCDRKKDLQDATIADAPGIEDDLNRFRMSGHAGANHLVVRRVRGAARVTGDGAKDALDMLVNTLDAPETPASEGCDLRFRK